MKWVGQEEPNGCVAATLAMILGYSYAEAAAILGKPHDSGCYSSVKQFQILWQCGYKTQMGYDVPGAAFHLCSVKIHHDSPVAHSVIRLLDGTVLDPMTPEPQRLVDYAVIAHSYGVTPPDKRR